MILVTGGAGRLGSEVVKLVAGRGFSVRAFDLPQAQWDAIRDIPDVEKFKGDITDLDQVAEACRQVDGVFHLAAILPPLSESNRDITMSVNVEGTRNILGALEENGVPIIFASSISTYGATAMERPPISENHPQQAHNNYSESKIEAERLIRVSKTPYVIFRIAPIAVADIIELPDTIPYRADQRVEFVYVSDAVHAFLSAFDNPETQLQTYNIAGGLSWQMTGAEYIKRFYDALGVEVEPHFSEDYTDLDWYDTSRSRFLNYQKVNFKGLLERLKVVAEQLGLR